MARLLFLFFAALTALGFGVAWLADRPGRVVIDWQDYRIETSLAAIVIALVVLVFVLTAVLRFLRWIFYGQAFGAQGRMRRNQQRGDKAIARGLTALAAGDAALAGKQARRALGYLKNSPFIPLIQAQAARLEGDSHKAAGFYQKLARHPETDLLGIRGLLYQALEAGDHDAARKLASKAVSLRPRTGWALSALFDLSLDAQDWKGAERATGTALQAGIMSNVEARRRTALISIMAADDKWRDGDMQSAEKAFVDAHKACPGLLPAALKAAEALIRNARQKRARSLIAAAWKETPHPRLAALYRETLDEPPGAAQLRAMETLVEDNSSHDESRLAVAEAALDAGMPGIARDALAPLTENPTSRVARLMARLAAQAGDSDGERQWLGKGIGAARPDPRWHCRHCAFEPADWEAVCSRCHSFDSVHWETPLLALDGPIGPAWKRLTEPGLIG